VVFCQASAATFRQAVSKNSKKSPKKWRKIQADAARGVENNGLLSRSLKE
jgi:hypothetical protein